MGKVGGGHQDRAARRQRLREGRSASMKQAQNARRRGGDTMSPDSDTARKVEQGAFKNDPTPATCSTTNRTGDGYSPHYQTNGKRGHSFYKRSVVPGSGLGDMVGRKTGVPILGDIVDFCNPLSDIQERRRRRRMGRQADHGIE